MMKQWMKQRAFVLFGAVLLALTAVFVGRGVVAQETDDPVEKRTDGGQGQTGSIVNMSAEQAQAILLQEENTVYQFAGALNNTVSAVNRATVVQCTNVGTETTPIELQLFQYNATSVYTGTVSVDPLDTATFESTSVEFYAADVVMGAGFVEQGYGRILAEHDEIICTVQTVDPDNIPPTWGFTLPLYHEPLSNVLMPIIMKNEAP